MPEDARKKHEAVPETVRRCRICLPCERFRGSAPPLAIDGQFVQWVFFTLRSSPSVLSSYLKHKRAVQKRLWEQAASFWPESSRPGPFRGSIRL
jgi:hypothetical protein